LRKAYRIIESSKKITNKCIQISNMLNVLDVQINSVSLFLINFREFVTAIEIGFCTIILKKENRKLILDIKFIDIDRETQYSKKALI